MKKILLTLAMTVFLGGNAMAITVNIYYTGENGNARKFAEEMEQSGTVAAIRAEEGNNRYEYFYPKNDPETVLLIDSWESEAAIDKHHASPMMSKITELRNKYDLHMKVERYIEDKVGIPSKDKNFIRE
jgi:quinol monooxygenase YgiN